MVWEPPIFEENTPLNQQLIFCKSTTF